MAKDYDPHTIIVVRQRSTEEGQLVEGEHLISGHFVGVGAVVVKGQVLRRVSLPAQRRRPLLAIDIITS